MTEPARAMRPSQQQQQQTDTALFLETVCLSVLHVDGLLLLDRSFPAIRNP